MSILWLFSIAIFVYQRGIQILYRAKTYYLKSTGISFPTVLSHVSPNHAYHLFWNHLRPCQLFKVDARSAIVFDFFVRYVAVLGTGLLSLAVHPPIPLLILASDPWIALQSIHARTLQQWHRWYSLFAPICALQLSLATCFLVVSHREMECFLLNAGRRLVFPRKFRTSAPPAFSWLQLMQASKKTQVSKITLYMFTTWHRPMYHLLPSGRLTQLYIANHNFSVHQISSLWSGGH